MSNYVNHDFNLNAECRKNRLQQMKAYIIIKNIVLGYNDDA